jgi:hypothetical protein
VSYLPDNAQKILRQIGKITDGEVVLKEGDLFIAVTVVDQKRRVLTLDENIVESLFNVKNTTASKQLLKG